MQYRYFEGFITAAFCQNQSERSLFPGTKNECNIIATLHFLRLQDQYCNAAKVRECQRRRK